MFWMLYITNPDRATAVRIGKELISKKTAACCNTVQVADSIYRWKGRVGSRKEWALIVKTANPKAAEALIRRVHPYSTPCITRWKVSANTEFENWVKAETK